MKKLKLALVLIIAHGGAGAQGYASNYEIESYCDTYASYAKASYGIKALNDTGTFKSNDSVEVRHARLRDEVLAKEEPSRGRDLKLFGLDFVYTRAKSDQDAYMATWAHCQDMLREPKPKKARK